MQKGLYGKPVCNEKYLITKIKSYDDKINKNFHDNGIPKETSNCVCLSLILIDSVVKTILLSSSVLN